MHDEEEIIPDAQELDAELGPADELATEISAEDLQDAEEDFGDPNQSVEIEEIEFIEEERVQSIIESVLFSTDKPVSLATIKQAFAGTSVKTEQIRRGINALQVEYAGAKRGVVLDEVAGSYQLRTKLDNKTYLRRMFKARPFKLSGPALEVLSIVAYKQPVIKAEIDQIRGVESGHLLRALMEKHLVVFAGKSELPGKPMQYATSRRFLEIFGLRNLKELPTLSEIDELLPEGIGDLEPEKAKLSDLTGELSQAVAENYSTGEEELLKINDQLAEIQTTTEFFEQEKIRQKEQRDRERAQDLREALAVGEQVDAKDLRWLEKYEQSQSTPTPKSDSETIAAASALQPQAADTKPAAGASSDPAKSSVELATEAALKAFDFGLDDEPPVES